MSARTPRAPSWTRVLKLDQNGKVLMMLGKMGVGGKGTDTFDRPTAVRLAQTGIFFVSDGHGGNVSHNARVLKFSKMADSSRPGVTRIGAWRFDDPHDIAIGGSMGRVYVPIVATVVSGFRPGRQISSPLGINLASQARFFVSPDDKIYVAFFALRQRRDATQTASSQVQTR